jgi:hypothetical protein
MNHQYYFVMIEMIDLNLIHYLFYYILISYNLLIIILMIYLLYLFIIYSSIIICYYSVIITSILILVSAIILNEYSHSYNSIITIPNIHYYSFYSKPSKMHSLSSNNLISMLSINNHIIYANLSHASSL